MDKNNVNMQEATNSSPYKISYPKGEKTNILISIPHCGTAFPNEIIDHYDQSKIQNLMTLIGSLKNYMTSPMNWELQSLKPSILDGSLI